MAAAAALVGRPSDGFAPTILHPSMSLNAYFQDIPFWNFFYAWFSAGDRQPVVLDLGALTAIYAIMRGYRTEGRERYMRRIQQPEPGDNTYSTI